MITLLQNVSNCWAGGGDGDGSVGGCGGSDCGNSGVVGGGGRGVLMSYCSAIQSRKHAPSVNTPGFSPASRTVNLSVVGL